jgi:hypothetical protein
LYLGIQGFDGENLKERMPLGKPKQIWEVNIKMVLKKDGRSWEGFMWLRIGARSGMF